MHGACRHPAHRGPSRARHRALPAHIRAALRPRKGPPPWRPCPRKRARISPRRRNQPAKVPPGPGRAVRGAGSAPPALECSQGLHQRRAPPAAPAHNRHACARASVWIRLFQFPANARNSARNGEIGDRDPQHHRGLRLPAVCMCYNGHPRRPVPLHRLSDVLAACEPSRKGPRRNTESLHRKPIPDPSPAPAPAPHRISARLICSNRHHSQVNRRPHGLPQQLKHRNILLRQLRHHAAARVHRRARRAPLPMPPLPPSGRDRGPRNGAQGRGHPARPARCSDRSERTHGPEQHGGAEPPSGVARDQLARLSGHDWKRRNAPQCVCRRSDFHPGRHGQAQLCGKTRSAAATLSVPRLSFIQAAHALHQH
eukprot:comp20501_c0_seq1/m.41417 comp20501_c0_seq1/g.41417  ORF comp20501_c0_seq1/g.41417 comp20501_c0_seq1/m.41417 type:complete len:369 (-) comp20501_c0_seq1:482-1588(-)